MNLLTICVTLSARYKLPIIREICICISNLNICMRSFKKKLLTSMFGISERVTSLISEFGNFLGIMSNMELELMSW